MTHQLAQPLHVHGHAPAREGEALLHRPLLAAHADARSGREIRERVIPHLIPVLHTIHQVHHAALQAAAELTTSCSRRNADLLRRF
jgi:hypothetical protein